MAAKLWEPLIDWCEMEVPFGSRAAVIGVNLYELAKPPTVSGQWFGALNLAPRGPRKGGNPVIAEFSGQLQPVAGYENRGNAKMTIRVNEDGTNVTSVELAKIEPYWYDENQWRYPPGIVTPKNVLPGIVSGPVESAEQGTSNPPNPFPAKRFPTVLSRTLVYAV